MKKVHFIAVGGAIMHQLALALNKKGYKVTGSDDEINDPAKSNLASAGILPEQPGWFPDKITGDIDAIVLGMHARADNPELIQAQHLHIPIYSFPEYVFEISRNKKRVVIAGSHGKTTITSMVMHILRHNNVKFDYLVGAKVAGFDESVHLSEAPLIILEGDEYPASVIEKRPKIFFYHPHITVLSGIAWDHINVFPTYDNYLAQFEEYLRGMEAGRVVLYNEEDNEVCRVIGTSAFHLQAIPYHTPAYHYHDGKAVLDTETGPVQLSVFGRHNLLNIEAAISVCTQLHISREKCLAAIQSFTGAARRLELLKEEKGLVVYRDFAHAPSKLKATLDAVREAYSQKRLIACFELHTFSSLNEQFLNQYKHAMDSCDDAIVYFSHHALELKGLPHLDKNLIKQSFGRDDLIVIDEKNSLLTEVKTIVQNASAPVCLLLMSSGTFDGIDWNAVSSQK